MCTVEVCRPRWEVSGGDVGTAGRCRAGRQERHRKGAYMFPDANTVELVASGCLGEGMGQGHP